jgi:hypothetical protein
MHLWRRKKSPDAQLEDVCVKAMHRRDKLIACQVAQSSGVTFVGEEAESGNFQEGAK